MIDGTNVDSVSQRINSETTEISGQWRSERQSGWCAKTAVNQRCQVQYSDVQEHLQPLDAQAAAAAADDDDDVDDVT